MHRPFLNVGYIGLLVFGMSLILLMVFPSTAPRLPDGFFTPVIAFEFVRTRVEVLQMFLQTNGAVRKDLVDAMNLGNRLDYIYMVLYALFLMGFSVKCAQLSEKRMYYTGAALSLMVLGADAMENMQLFAITAGLETGNLEPFLGRLFIFTWIKWGGIGAVFLVLVPWFLKGRMFSKIIALAMILTVMLGVAAFVRRSVITEMFALGVGLVFLMMIIYCFVGLDRHFGHDT